MKLFNKLVCKPGPNATTVDDNWKKTVGYTDAADQWDVLASQTVSCDPNGNKYVLGPAVFEGTQLTDVTAALQQNSTQWVVNLTLNSAATKAFGTLTTNQYNNYYPTASTNQNDAALDSTAIVLDGNVQSAPETQGALTSGQFTISGPQPNGFTEAQAIQLTNVLKYGQLPLNFTLEDVQSISPQVGHSSLDAGLFAGILGLILVIIYLFYYYRGLGIVSVSSLLIAALLAYLAVVCSAGTRTSPCRCRRSPASWWRSASPPTRSSSTSSGSVTRCGTARRCGPRSKPAGSGPGARSWSPTRCPSWPPCCCTTSRSATFRASPTRSA